MGIGGPGKAQESLEPVLIISGVGVRVRRLVPAIADGNRAGDVVRELR